MTVPLSRRCLSEALGTFVIVACPVALSAAGRLPGADATLAAAAWVSGLPVAAMIYALGHVGGAHLNPAVSVALASSGRFPWREVPAYALAQAAGSFLAAAVVALCLGPGAHGVHIPAVSAARAVGIEALLTFLLMLTILGAATDRRAPAGFAGVAIGLTVVAGVWIGGAATGGSMNPARSLGPALLAGGPALQAWWIYLVGPMLGAQAATWLHRPLRPREP